MGTVEDDLERLTRVCAAYGLGGLRAARYLPVGVINRNWQVDTTTGAFAVKQLSDPLATGVREQHRVMKALIGRGVPIPEPIELDGGDPVCVVDGAEFTVSVWAPGRHLSGTEMSLAQATALGKLLGSVHIALAEVLGPGVAGPGIAVPDRGEALSYLDCLLRIIEARPDKDEIDQVAFANLTWRRTVLTDPARSAPAPPELGPQGYIHGDFHPNNVLWQDGRVSAVVDWDRVRVHSLAAELIRACLLIFGGIGGLDLPRVAAFVSGYRLRRPLTRALLADAERRMWWLWLNGFWPLDQRYERGNTTFDHLYVHNAATFRWWTENRPEVVAAFTDD